MALRSSSLSRLGSSRPSGAEPKRADAILAGLRRAPTRRVVFKIEEELLRIMRGRELESRTCALRIRYFAFQLANYIYFLKEDYHVREKICKSLTLFGGST